jgi:hypothetical protein
MSWGCTAGRFSLGLVLEGVLVDRIGWRYGYYIVSIANVVIFVWPCGDCQEFESRGACDMEAAGLRY